MQNEMRRKDKQVTSQAWIEDVLQRAEWLELGLAGPDGWPYVVPLNFAYKDGYLILHGAAASKKVNMLAENPKVCFQAAIDTEVIRNEMDPSEFSMKYRSVTGFGLARSVDDIDEKRECLKELMYHYDGPVEPMPDAMLQRTLVIKVEIKEMTGKISGYPKPE